SNLFGGDALTLDDQPCPVSHADITYIAACLVRPRSQQDMAASFAYSLSELGNQLGQICDRAFFDLPGLVFQCFIIRQQAGCPVAVAIECMCVVANGGALDAQGHSNGPQQPLAVAFVRHGARRVSLDGWRVDRSHRRYSSTKICNQCGPCTPRTSGPMSAVALGPVIKTRLRFSASPPRQAGSNRSRGRFTIRFAQTRTTCNGIRRLPAAASGGPIATQTDPLEAIPAKALLMPASAVESISSDGWGTRPGNSRNGSISSEERNSAGPRTITRESFTTRATAARTAAGELAIRSTVATAL